METYFILTHAVKFRFYFPQDFSAFNFIVFYFSVQILLTFFVNNAQTFK